MIELSKRHQEIIKIILEKGVFQSSTIHSEILKSTGHVSLVTVKRALSEMVVSGILKLTGSGRSTSYNITTLGRVSADINAKSYCAIDPDRRYGINSYDFDLFSELPGDLFDNKDLTIFNHATSEYIKRTKNISKTIQKKELERLIIELSWKSSKIEGNTYTLLDTENLILENKEAPGHDKNEARMILNHKEAFNFVRENTDEFKTLNRVNLEKLHAILVKDMGVGLGFRNGLVGITGSKYQPLDNIHQIREAVTALSNAISKMETPYSKALLAILGISYIQPFEDGNKRTSRLMANALLLSHGLAPLSYRSVEENEYREAMLVFYELNSIVPFKKIFIGQYEFAAKNYAVKPVS
ncbi:MAG: Fic family protein [Candidatus Gracilibacteria bacterium]